MNLKGKKVRIPLAKFKDQILEIKVFKVTLKLKISQYVKSNKHSKHTGHIAAN